MHSHTHTRTRTHTHVLTHIHTQVQVAVSANDVMDDRTLVRRYRQEAAELRKQLTALLALQNCGQPMPSHHHQLHHAGSMHARLGGAFV
jgi:hypothetical protein